MFIIDLTYIVPLDNVDHHLEAHIAFLNRQYEAGHFLASGRKLPRTGGVILARGASMEVVQQLITEDPFHIHQLAEYTITEFVPSKTIPELAFLQQ